MSNALRKKKKPTFFTKKDTMIIGRNDFESRNTERVVIKSYKDYLAIGYMVLHDEFGFGQKRMIRLEQTVNSYSEASVNDSNMKGTALAFILKDKYEVDVTDIVNRVPQSQLMKLYAIKGRCVEREAYRLSRASMFNYLALTITALKKMFGFTRKQLSEFSNKFIDYIDTLANYKQFQLTVPMIAQSLADEIKFVCDLEA